MNYNPFKTECRKKKEQTSLCIDRKSLNFHFKKAVHMSVCVLP